MQLKNKRLKYNYLPGFLNGLDGMAQPPSGYTPFWQNSYLSNQIGVPGSIRYPGRINVTQGQPGAGVGGKLASNASGIISSGVAFGGDIANAFSGVKSSSDILDETGSSYSNGIGYGYQKVNDIDYDKQLTEIRKEGQANTLKTTGTGMAAGAAVGSVFGPVGGAIGAAVGALGGLVTGLFGSAHRKRKMQRRLEEARIRGIGMNNYNQASAQSDYIANRYYNENGTTDDDMLLAKRGKDAGIKGNNINKENSVYTSLGKVSAKPNARVAAGESILDNLDDVSNATGHVVKEGKLGKDTNLANLGENTVVLGQDVDWRTGTTFRDQSLPYTQALEKINKKYENRINEKLNKLRGSIGTDSDKLQQQEVDKIKQPIVDKLKDLADQQAIQHKGQQYMNNNTLPGFGGGKPAGYNLNYGYIQPMSWSSNAIPMGLGALASISQYLQAKNQAIHTPDIYTGNPYEAAALEQMAKLRVDPYRAIQAVNQQAAQDRYNINRAGGLSGAQKYLANVAAGLGTQRNIADVIRKSQEINNQYIGKWAEAALSAGNASAQRRQQANQYNTEYAASAHAARQQGMQMGLRNFMDYIQQYAANEYKRRTGNGMLGLYQQKVDMDRENMRSYYNKDNRETGDLIVPTQPVVGDVVYPNITSGVYNIQNPGTIKLRNNKQLNNSVRYSGYPTQNVQPYQYIPNTNYITNFTQMPPINYKWNDII